MSAPNQPNVPNKPNGPNVLLVVWDTARADATEPYGAPAGSTPTLAQLASAGRAVPHAMASACWTVPSHISLLEGLLPRSAGMGPARPDQPGWGHVVRAGSSRSLPGVLGARGWQTAGVSANAWVSSAHGFDDGFDDFHLVARRRQGRIGATDLRGRLGWTLEALRARTDDGASEIQQMLEAWVARRDRAPFFWFVNLVECHSPYLPPVPYCDVGLRDRWCAAVDARQWQTFASITATCLGATGPPADALDRMRHLYGRSITLLDDWLARVLAALDGHGLLEETIVVVTSDHGENFGEDGLIGHAFSLDDRLMRVPLVLAGPGVADAPLPADGAFSIGGVPALLASLLGIDEHPWGPPDRTGVAVAQLDPPTRADDPRVEESLAGLGLADDPEARRRLLGELTCATDGRHKLVRDALGDEYLVEPGADGTDTDHRPVEDLDADQLGWLRAALDMAGGLEVEAAAPSTSTRGTVADLEERMRLLGYL